MTPTERETPEIVALQLLEEARDLMWYATNGTTDDELQDMAEKIQAYLESLSSGLRMRALK